MSTKTSTPGSKAAQWIRVVKLLDKQWLIPEMSFCFVCCTLFVGTIVSQLYCSCTKCTALFLYPAQAQRISLCYQLCLHQVFPSRFTMNRCCPFTLQNNEDRFHTGGCSPSSWGHLFLLLARFPSFLGCPVDFVRGHGRSQTEIQAA